MKRSTQVAAPLLAAAALAMTVGCRRPQMQRCVDENHNVVDDSLCNNQPNQQNNNTLFPHTYHYYYGGWGGYGLGGTAAGGSYIPSPGVSYTTRGGFGSSFAEGSGSHAS